MIGLPENFFIPEHDFLKCICPDDKSHITQSLSRLPEYKICSSALNRSDVIEPLNSFFKSHYLFATILIVVYK